MTALVTCGHTRQGLHVARSLGRAGVAVAVGAPRKPALAMWSRFTSATLLLPDPNTDAQLFASVVKEQAHGRAAVAVFAGTDEAQWALCRWKDDLPASARKILPPRDALARTLDRTTLHDLASTVGVRCLDVLRVDSEQAVEPALREAKRMGMPALVRPIIPWVEREGGTRRSRQGIPVAKLSQLRRLLYDRADLVDPGCLIEPRPPGQTLGYGTICRRGEPLVEVFQERVRERRRLSGESTVAATVPPDPKVREIGRTVLAALGWQGPALIELLRTKDGDLRLVSVVGRLWGSSLLAAAAGVDVPLLLYRMASGETLPEGLVARPGVRFRWLLGDVQQGLSRAAGAFDPVSGGLPVVRRARAVAELFDPRLVPHVVNDVLDAEDPLPFVFELQGWLQGFRR